MMYRGFKQECPNGAVNEDTFKEIYEKFFPHGSKLIRWTGLEVLSPHFFLFNQATPRGKFHDMRFPWSDVTSYAHHVFKAFDVNSTGSISFRVIAQLSRTSTCCGLGLTNLCCRTCWCLYPHFFMEAFTKSSSGEQVIFKTCFLIRKTRKL